jgi:hypothetical protein
MPLHDHPEKAVKSKRERPEPDGLAEPKTDNEDLDQDYDLRAPAHKPPEAAQTPQTEVPRS